jgi:WD40 repeat protein
LTNEPPAPANNTPQEPVNIRIAREAKAFRKDNVVVSAVAVSWDKSQIALGELYDEENTQVVVWDLNEWKPSTTFNYNKDMVSSMDFAPNGKTLAVGYATKGDRAPRQPDYFILWRIPSAYKMIRLPTAENEVGRDIAFSPDGNLIGLVGDADAFIYYIDSNDVENVADHLKLLRTIHYADKSARSISFSQNGKYVAIGFSDGSAKVWELQGTEPLNLIEVASFATDLRENVSNVLFSPDHTRLALTVNETVTVWNIAGGTLLQTLRHTKPVHDLSFSVDGQFLATASEFAAYIWDVPSSTQRCALTVNSRKIIDLDYLDPGRIVGGASNGDIYVWEDLLYCNPLKP